VLSSSEYIFECAYKLIACILSALKYFFLKVVSKGKPIEKFNFYSKQDPDAKGLLHN